jgi:hypothetical protein
MTPEQIIAALEREGDMVNVVQLGKSEYRGTRKGKAITVKVIKYRGNWQLTATDGSRPIPSNTSPWQQTIFSDLHWSEFD